MLKNIMKTNKIIFKNKIGFFLRYSKALFSGPSIYVWVRFMMFVILWSVHSIRRRHNEGSTKVVRIFFFYQLARYSYLLCLRYIYFSKDNITIYICVKLCRSYNAVKNRLNYKKSLLLVSQPQKIKISFHTNRTKFSFKIKCFPLTYLF